MEHELNNRGIGLGMGYSLKFSYYGCVASELEGSSASLGGSGGAPIAYGGELIFTRDRGLIGTSVTIGPCLSLLPELNGTAYVMRAPSFTGYFLTLKDSLYRIFSLSLPNCCSWYCLQYSE